MTKAWKFVIEGAPRTKKNSPQMVQARGGHPCPLCKQRRGRWFPVPSAESKKWTAAACRQLRMQWTQLLPLVEPVQVAAIFYRDRDVGDLVNYEQALADALQTAKVVKDDKWIKSWDGSRLAKDAARPRIELTITPIGVQPALLEVG